MLVETRDLTKRYRSLTAVSELNLNVRRGEVYGFLGPNGAGKTTTLRMLLGLIRPTSGMATVLGESSGKPESLKKWVRWWSRQRSIRISRGGTTCA